MISGASIAAGQSGARISSDASTRRAGAAYLPMSMRRLRWGCCTDSDAWCSMGAPGGVVRWGLAGLARTEGGRAGADTDSRAAAVEGLADAADAADAADGRCSRVAAAAGGEGEAAPVARGGDGATAGHNVSTVWASRDEWNRRIQREVQNAGLVWTRYTSCVQSPCSTEDPGDGRDVVMLARPVVPAPGGVDEGCHTGAPSGGQSQDNGGVKGRQ
ncbi:unnamed protein product [Sphagnum jensenii]